MLDVVPVRTLFVDIKPLVLILFERIRGPWNNINNEQELNLLSFNNKYIIPARRRYFLPHRWF